MVAASGPPPKNPRVPKTLDDQLRDLSAQYHSAYAAHEVLAMAIAEFAMAGERPPDLLQDSEKEAALELAKVTDELRRAMAELAERAAAGQAPKPSSAVREPRAGNNVVTPLKQRAVRR